MILLCHLEAEICRTTVPITPIIEDLMSVNPFHKLVKPFEVIVLNLSYLMTGLNGNRLELKNVLNFASAISARVIWSVDQIPGPLARRSYYMQYSTILW